LTSIELLNAITEIIIYVKILPVLKANTTFEDDLKSLELETKSGPKNGIHENMHAVEPYDKPKIKRENKVNISIYYTLKFIS